MNKVVKQFEIWEINLNPTKGSEQKGKRPCLILQTNASGNYAKTTMIAPLTTKKIENIYPFEVEIKPSKENGLKDISKIKFDQIRIIDKLRAIKKNGKLEKNYYKNILQAINIIFDIDGNFR